MFCLEGMGLILCMTNLTKREAPLVMPGVSRLICAHGNLRVPGPIHGALIDVGRPTNNVLVVHHHSLGVHVDHESPMLQTLALHKLVTGFLLHQQLLYS